MSMTGDMTLGMFAFFAAVVAVSAVVSVDVVFYFERGLIRDFREWKDWARSMNGTFEALVKKEKERLPEKPRTSKWLQREAPDSCPKCGCDHSLDFRSGASRVKYWSLTTGDKTQEWLSITCGTCGFASSIQTADAD